MAAALKAIAHPDRIRILLALGCRKRLSVSELQAAVGLTQPMTSEHLSAMRAQGIIAPERSENKMYYSIVHTDVLKVIACVSRCADSRAAA